MLNAASLAAIETAQEVMCNMREPVELRLSAAKIVLTAMPPTTAALEKALRHRLADFSLEERFERGSTYDSAGHEILKFCASTNISARNKNGGVTV
jgi:hypothetical protein